MAPAAVLLGLPGQETDAVLTLVLLTGRGLLHQRDGRTQLAELALEAGGAAARVAVRAVHAGGAVLRTKRETLRSAGKG